MQSPSHSKCDSPRDTAVMRKTPSPEFDQDVYSCSDDDDLGAASGLRGSSEDNCNYNFPPPPRGKNPMDDFTLCELISGSVKKLPTVFEDYREVVGMVASSSQTISRRHSHPGFEIFKTWIRVKETPLQEYIRRRLVGKKSSVGGA
jgi:hypothetical protein